MKVSVVIPSFNEEGNVVVLAKKLLNIFTYLACEYELIFVDDGSSDLTFEKLKELHEENPHVHYISFSRNFGHQCALKAGLDYAQGDCVVSLDADMQHPPELIPEMVQKWQEGYDIVYTKRLVDKKLPFFKRLTSQAFYQLINFLSDVTIEDGTADFRLMDRNAVEVFKHLPERDLFVRGMVKWIGFKQYKIDYQPHERFSGTTKYSFRKMLRLAMTGITSFSVKPLRLAGLLGFFLSTVSFAYGLLALYGYFLAKWNVSGWTSLAVGIMFIGGVQLIMLGIIGEYLGKLFMQVKQRPLYIIKKTSLPK
jgi:dolichol-phosphate mannosyltransferase